MDWLCELELPRVIGRGVERECLRIASDGTVAQTPHPNALGQALSHPYVTTDYSEALLEFVTPVFTDPQELLDFLRDLHLFTLKHMNGEIFWNNSMPCTLRGDEDIPIAHYGKSNIGKMKTIYRRGLFHRYGPAMQAISGIHFNFSLSDECFEQLRERDGFKGELQDYKSCKYMAAMRNLHKHSWVIPLVMGCSPAICGSFLRGIQGEHGLISLDGEGTLTCPGASSLRLSKIGYTTAAQSRVNICYDSLESYVQGLRHATMTGDEEWEKIGVKHDGRYLQLNSNILQLENEYYSGFRPKRRARSGESPSNALMSRGIEYIEVRAVDINSFSPIGIELQQILFLDVFLLYCLFAKDERAGKKWARQYRDNQEFVARHGRAEGAMLWRSGKRVKLQDWARELFGGLLEIAAVLDGKYSYTQAVQGFQDAISDPRLLYSARLEQEMRESKESFFHYMLKKSLEISGSLQSLALDRQQEQHFIQVSEQSARDQSAIKQSDRLSLDEFLTDYVRRNGLTATPKT